MDKFSELGDFSGKFWTYGVKYSGLEDWINGKARELSEGVNFMVDQGILREIDQTSRHRLALQLSHSEIDPRKELEITEYLDSIEVWWSMLEGNEEDYLLFKFPEFRLKMVPKSLVPDPRFFVSYEKVIVPSMGLLDEITDRKIQGDKCFAMYHQYPRTNCVLMDGEYSCDLDELSIPIIDNLITDEYDLMQKLWMRGFFDLIKDDGTRNYIFQELRRVYYDHNQVI